MERTPMQPLPTVDFYGRKVSRLICGGNPLSGFSHISSELDWEMIRYHTMDRIQQLWRRCWDCGINTIQIRGDAHMLRAYLEHRMAGGQVQLIAQTASEVADHVANVRKIARYEPIAIYHHGTNTDNAWHAGQIDKVRDVIKAIHDAGLPAGVGSHRPDVIRYMEDAGWETDFYMCCFYNLARGYKAAPAAEKYVHAKDRFPPEDPAHMAAVMRRLAKPCIAFKILAAGRNCATPDDPRAAFRFAFENIKPSDVVNVGMWLKHRDQVAENAAIVREILIAPATA